MDDLNLREMTSQGLLAAGAGLLGRLMALSRNPTKRLGWNLLWELPQAVGCGFAGMAVAMHLHLGPWESIGLAICVAYVGPPMIDLAIQRWLGSVASTSPPPPSPPAAPPAP